MARAPRLLALLLVLAGLATSAFFWLLFAIADCTADCVARGERAVPLALVGVGIGLAVAGALLFREPPSRAAAWGILAAGVVGAGWIGWIMATEGSRGQAVWLLLATGALALAGAAMLARGRGGGRPVV